MNEIDIDVIGAEAPQALVRRFEDMMARQTLMNQRFAASKTHFRRNHDVFSSVAERFREYLLGLAARIHVCRIEVIDTGIERPGDKLFGQILIDFRYTF